MRFHSVYWICLVSCSFDYHQMQMTYHTCLSAPSIILATLGFLFHGLSTSIYKLPCCVWLLDICFLNLWARFDTLTIQQGMDFPPWTWQSHSFSSNRSISSQMIVIICFCLPGKPTSTFCFSTKKMIYLLIFLIYFNSLFIISRIKL